jgi:hypothetical protein
MLLKDLFSSLTQRHRSGQPDPDEAGIDDFKASQWLEWTRTEHVQEPSTETRGEQDARPILLIIDHGDCPRTIPLLLGQPKRTFARRQKGEECTAARGE